jgi:GNAT superfamily N-acetyltransferase
VCALISSSGQTLDRATDSARDASYGLWRAVRTHRVQTPSNPNTCSTRTRHADAKPRCAARPATVTVGDVSELVIRLVDPYDDEDMDGFQQVYADAEHAEDPEPALYSRADAVRMLTSTDSGFFAQGWGAFLDGVMVGEAMVSGSSDDAADLARVWVWVRPGHRRGGVGSRLVERAEGAVRERGRSVCQSQARLGADRTGGNRAFAEGHGYRLVNTEIERRLPLPVDPSLLDRLAAEAAPYHRGYEIRSVVGPVPPDLAASYVRLENRLTLEMPHGDLDVEEDHDTVDRLAAQDRELSASGRTRVAAYALDANGIVVGYSAAAVTNEHHHHVAQLGTLVDRGHRGHRLGLAVKVAQARVLGERFADKRFVHTTNAESNAHMVAINEALGFEIHQVFGDFQKRL